MAREKLGESPFQYLLCARGWCNSPLKLSFLYLFDYVIGELNTKRMPVLRKALASSRGSQGMELLNSKSGEYSVTPYSRGSNWVFRNVSRSRNAGSFFLSGTKVLFTLNTLYGKHANLIYAVEAKSFEPMWKKKQIWKLSGGTRAILRTKVRGYSEDLNQKLKAPLSAFSISSAPKVSKKLWGKDLRCWGIRNQMQAYPKSSETTTLMSMITGGDSFSSCCQWNWCLNCKSNGGTSMFDDVIILYARSQCIILLLCFRRSNV